MARKPPKNQLPLDFSVHGNRIILNLGSPAQQLSAKGIFDALIAGQWQLEPAGEAADISFAQDIIATLAHKLPYPEGIRIAQLNGDDAHFDAFSAIFHQKGWVILRAEAPPLERNYLRYLLTASLGLQGLYTSEESLLLRSEQLVFDALLPADEVESFFRADIVKIPPFLASDIATHFSVPFPIVLKRALQLSLISDSQYRNFMTVRPEPGTKPPALFIAKEEEH